MVNELVPYAKEIRERLINECIGDQRTVNGFSALDGKIICVFSGRRVYLTDKRFYPIFAYERTSHVIACAVSATAKYMFAQMAPNRENDEDSNAAVLIDVKAKEVISKRCLPTRWEDVTLSSIDEQMNCIWIYYGDKCVEYDFRLQANPEALRKYWKKYCRQPNASPYVVNAHVNELLAQETSDNIQWAIVEAEARKLMRILDKGPRVSPYQLSLTYESLGNLYIVHGEHKRAVWAFEKGLALNPKLPVKRKLAQEKKAASEQ